MTDIAARHKPRDTGNECAYCHNESWPCDAELLRRERDEYERRWQRGREYADHLASQRDAAEADAARLAKLATRLPCECGEREDTCARCAALIEHDKRTIVGPALAAHDARVSRNASDSATDARIVPGACCARWNATDPYELCIKGIDHDGLHGAGWPASEVTEWPWSVGDLHEQHRRRAQGASE